MDAIKARQLSCNAGFKYKNKLPEEIKDFIEKFINPVILDKANKGFTYIVFNLNNEQNNDLWLDEITKQLEKLLYTVKISSYGYCITISW